jgi:HPt (histidine-containing phosphotransfer) domain-containing protein
LNVGFDDILIKPFKRADIEGSLHKWIGRSRDPAPPDIAAPEAIAAPPPAAGAASIPPAAAVPDLAVFDREEALDTFMHEEEAVRDLLLRFVTRTEKHLAEDLPRSLKTGDWETGRRDAHTIKGGVLTLGGRELGSVAAKLEIAFKDADRDGAAALLPPLGEAFGRFKAAVTAYLDAGAGD